MNDKNLVRKLQLLKEIKPRKDWVVLTKSQILGEEPTLVEQVSTFIRISFQYKPAYKRAFIGLVSLILLIGTFAFAKNALPGDPLYVLKRLTEKGQAVFVSEEKLPRYNLEIANKRLEELSQIAQTNQVRKLAPALNEFQSSVSEAAENLAKIKEPKKAHEAAKAIVLEIKKLKENQEKIKTLGVVIGDGKEIEDAMCPIVESSIVEREIEALGELTVEQEELLEQAEEYLEEGECSSALEALEIILSLSYPQE